MGFQSNGQEVMWRTGDEKSPCSLLWDKVLRHSCNDMREEETMLTWIGHSPWPHTCNDRRGVIDHALPRIASDIVALYCACDDMRGGETSAAIPTKLPIVWHWKLQTTKWNHLSPQNQNQSWSPCPPGDGSYQFWVTKINKCWVLRTRKV
jgi:hypothetical protein